MALSKTTPVSVPSARRDHASTALGHGATQPIPRAAWPADHHLFTGSLKFKDGLNPNRTARTGKGPRDASIFDPVHPEYPPCTYDPPPFLRTRPLKIGEKEPVKPPKSTIGPGTYTPMVSETVHVKVYRKGEVARESWPHLKRDAQLPEPGKYWNVRPFFEPPKYVRTNWPPRTYQTS
jgi:hypothetical protein